MIKYLDIKRYKKLVNTKLLFTEGINVISGANGTCKSSILHLISNSFQEGNKKNVGLIDDNAIRIIKKVNTKTNPKVEWLTRGDKKYNDPTNGKKGIVYTANYLDDISLNFRKHNSIKSHRYSLKPQYSKSKKDSLPVLPIIYQSLSRLHPFGEFQDDDAISAVNDNLPLQYINDVNDLYNSLTSIKVEKTKVQDIGSIKIRTDFTSTVPGIDSNTISSGEDNLYSLLLSLVSLKYLFDSKIDTDQEVSSILLIDEYDASLHPSLQIGLIDLFKEYSDKYKIQIILTTHSLDFLDYSFQSKFNVIYLIDNVETVMILPDPDIYKIKMHLKGLTRSNIYEGKVIPIFTEDDEARFIINHIFDFYTEKVPSFGIVRNFFHQIESNFSCESLINIFKDKYLSKTTIQSICILDGDQKTSLNDSIIALPGEKSPEDMIFKHSKDLYNKRIDFWENVDLVSNGYSRSWYKYNILSELDSIEKEIFSLKEKQRSTKGVIREKNKKLFNKHKDFFEFVLDDWIKIPSNLGLINKFMKNLNCCFKKVSAYHQINPKEWEFIEVSES